jgi:hypothetical protein
MKSRLFAIFAAAALGTAALPETASAQATWATSRPLTVALTISYTAPGLMMKDENGKVLPASEGGGPAFENNYSVSTVNADGEVTKQVDTMESGGKTVIVKYGNVEVLKELLAQDMLPGIGTKEPSISGWSLVIIGDAIEGTDSVFARHTTKIMVPVEGISFGLSEEFAVASTYSHKSVTTITTSPSTGETTEKTVTTGTGSSKGLGFGSVPGIEGFHGHFTSAAGKTIVKIETIEGEKFPTEVHTPGAQKLEKIAGAVEFELSESGAGYLEGSMSTTAATVVDMNIYSAEPQ